MAAGGVMTKSGFNNILQLSFTGSSTKRFQYFIIGTGDTTPTTSDTGLESTITSWTEGGTSFKEYVSVLFNSSSQQVTVRGFISAAEATSKVLYEYADVNNDTTKAPAGRFVWNDSITKTTANQVTIVTVYKMR